MITTGEIIEIVQSIRSDPNLECFIVIMPVSKAFLRDIDKSNDAIEQILIDAVSDKLRELYNGT